jgi:hypothetical protein
VSERALQAALVFIGAMHLAFGALALIAPGTFFDQIGDYGARNLHYVGDVGAFYAAAGIVTLAAVRWPGWRVPVLVMTAAWYGLHALNHAFDVNQAQTDARGISDTVLLAVGAGISAYLARAAAQLGDAR